MIEIRPYQWGDREKIDGVSVIPFFIPDAVTVTQNGRPVVAGGLVYYAPGNFEVWAVFDKKSMGPGLWKSVVKVVQQWKSQERVKRLFCFVNPHDAAAKRTAIRLGMVFEALLQSWWDGEDRNMHGWVK